MIFQKYLNQISNKLLSPGSSGNQEQLKKKEETTRIYSGYSDVTEGSRFM